MKTETIRRWFSRPVLLAPAALLLPLVPAFAQTAAAPAASPAQLPKYDPNKNGGPDPAELARMQADEAKAPVTGPEGVSTRDEAVQLSPFEVKEDNNGYYAANTM